MKVKKSSDRKLGTDFGTFSSSRHRVTQREDVNYPKFDDSLEAAEIHELLNRLDSLGDKLSRFPSETILRDYRNVVGELLKRATGRLRLKKDLRWRRYDKNIFVLMEKTESALQELSVVFLREGERTRSLRLMEEIKGCLLSLLL